MKEYDFLIVGSGFFGAICAHELKKEGYNVLVIDKRNHIGGNCYTKNVDGINLHVYGPHIFHTSNDKVWNWINQFVKFNDFNLRPVAHYKGEVFSLPFNMWTFSKIFNKRFPDEISKIIELESKEVEGDPKNFEEQAIKLVGKTVYEKLIKGYTTKQWQTDPVNLPKEIIKRLPVRLTYDNNYFNDIYQGIPIGGYTQIFDKLLEGIDILLNTDFFIDTLPKYKNLIYTGPIDKYYNYKYGKLEYKTLEWKWEKVGSKNYQGTAMINETDIDVPFTRTIEHKFFDLKSSETDITWLSREYPTPFIADSSEPLYPVNDIKNNTMYSLYLKDALNEKNIFFGGRLAEYKYYDMHQIIESALNKIINWKKNRNE